jgi:hypothetical protein
MITSRCWGTSKSSSYDAPRRTLTRPMPRRLRPLRQVSSWQRPLMTRSHRLLPEERKKLTTPKRPRRASRRKPHHCLKQKTIYSMTSLASSTAPVTMVGIPTLLRTTSLVSRVMLRILENTSLKATVLGQATPGKVHPAVEAVNSTLRTMVPHHIPAIINPNPRREFILTMDKVICPRQIPRDTGMALELPSHSLRHITDTTLQAYRSGMVAFQVSMARGHVINSLLTTTNKMVDMELKLVIPRYNLQTAPMFNLHHASIILRLLMGNPHTTPNILLVCPVGPLVTLCRSGLHIQGMV